MIGWWIVISTQTPEERRQAVDRKAFILATWEVGLGGLDWLEQLVAQGHAGRLRSDGYPNVYVAAAPDGHPKLLHCWPVKLLQAGRGDYAGSGVMASRAAASLSR